MCPIQAGPGKSSRGPIQWCERRQTNRTWSASSQTFKTVPVFISNSARSGFPAENGKRVMADLVYFCSGGSSRKLATGPHRLTPTLQNWCFDSDGHQHPGHGHVLLVLRFYSYRNFSFKEGISALLIADIMFPTVLICQTSFTKSLANILKNEFGFRRQGDTTQCHQLWCCLSNLYPTLFSCSHQSVSLWAVGREEGGFWSSFLPPDKNVWKWPPKRM